MEVNQIEPHFSRTKRSACAHLLVPNASSAAHWVVLHRQPDYDWELACSDPSKPDWVPHRISVGDENDSYDCNDVTDHEEEFANGEVPEEPDSDADDRGEGMEKGLISREMWWGDVLSGQRVARGIAAFLRLTIRNIAIRVRV